MALAQLPLDGALDLIADWFEFQILHSEYSVQQLRVIQRTWDKRKNSEDADPEGHIVEDDASDESFLESVTLQFQERIKYLGESYPFEFSNNGEELSLKSELSDGAHLYLFCLLLSNANKPEIFELDKFDYELTNRIRDLFQACSTWAAAGFIAGCAVAFGFPRPDGSSFLTKLRECYGQFGEGEVRERPLPGVSPNPKDEGIDVIAWKPRRDNSPGTQYILGQVASGRNWQDKSIREYIQPFHNNWFTTTPASDPTPAMFIPFCIPLSTGANLQQQLSVLTRRYGSIHYRYTIPHYANLGLQLAQSNADLSVDRIGDLPEIRDWVSATINSLKASQGNLKNA